MYARTGEDAREGGALVSVLRHIWWLASTASLLHPTLTGFLLPHSQHLFSEKFFFL